MAPNDPVSYVRSLAPFHALPEALFGEVASTLEVGLYEAGEMLAEVGVKPLRHLYVIRKGAVRLEREGKGLQLLEEGEIFGYTSLLTGKATLDVRVEEDLLAYRFPGEVFQRLLADARFAAHFAVGLSERLKASLEHSAVATFQTDLGAPVSELVRREAVWVDPGITVGDAARVMRRENISSVLVRSDPPGILTDRDLRNRVLAAGLGAGAPIEGIFTRQLLTVDAATPIHDAWRLLLDARIHHFPVTRAGVISGVYTSTDLLRCSVSGPVAMLRGVERLASRDALPGYADRMTEMVSALLAGGLEATVIAGLVARLNDALLRPILRWAEADLGPPPAPYAWIVFGSEGRMEQTLLTDQDNALVYADAGASQADWFRRFAELVNADLVAAGFPVCPGGFMARSWHGTLTSWAERFRGWIEVPTPQALLVASIFFDFRRVGGTLDLSPLEELVAAAGARPVFLKLLAQDALRFRPPPGLLLRLRGKSSEVDLKLHGISPIVFLTRCYALESGITERPTLERLAAAVRAGKLDAADESRVAEAYRFLLGLRLRLQLRMAVAHKPVTNAVRMSELSAMERSRVRDVFHAIRSWQEGGAYQFKAEA
ncbi:MAG: CBS domain-containing protein [Deltaproteobacteria bacterium]|nr:CBS domain-containing protein [Deltaproteobacteria bacterium]